jgi:MFS family permease
MADIPGGPPPPPPPPPPGSMPGSGGLPPRGIGEILTTAFEIYKDNAASLLLIVAVVVVPLSLLSALLAQAFAPETTVEIGGPPVESRSFFVALLAGLIVVAIGFVIGAILQAAILRGAAQATIGDPVDIEGSYRWGLRRLGSVLLISLLVALIVAVGLFLLIIPGIILGVFLSVAIPALVVENQRGTDALKRSWNLVSGHFWHALAVLVVAAIIAAIVGLILGLIGGSNWFVSWIFSAIAQIITAPFTALVGIILYLDLRARKESLSAEMLRAELASSM